MIVDALKHSNKYKTISSNLDRALSYLQTMDLEKLELGRYEIDGDEVFVLIQGYAPKSLEQGKCEAHKNYIDIQYVIEGEEMMGYMPAENGQVLEAYDETKDRWFMKWAGDLISFEKGMIGIFFPEDGHMPGLKAEGCQYVKKAVVKVKVQ